MNFYSLSAPLLKEERKRLGLSQAEAAEKCGVSREIWGRYERGAAVPGGEVLKALADLGANVQYILTGSNRQTSAGFAHGTGLPGAELPPDEQLLLEAYRGLTAAARKVLLAELLTGSKPKKPSRKQSAEGGVSVSGDGNRVAGRDYQEKG